jgi:hypothetical protein
LRYFPHSALLVAVTKLAKPEPPPEEEEAAAEPQLEFPREPAKPRGRAQRPEF